MRVVTTVVSISRSTDIVNRSKTPVKCAPCAQPMSVSEKNTDSNMCAVAFAMQNQSETLASSDQRKDFIPEFLWFGIAAVRHYVVTTHVVLNQLVLATKWEGCPN